MEERWGGTHLGSTGKAEKTVTVPICRLLRLLADRPKEFIVVGQGIFIDVTSGGGPAACGPGPLEPQAPEFREGEALVQDLPDEFTQQRSATSAGGVFTLGCEPPEEWRIAGGKGCLVLRKMRR